MATYSFKDLTAAFSHPLAGIFLITGQVGAGNVTISNSQERTKHSVSNDGTTTVTYIAGDNGQVTFEMQQTSAFHKFLLSWFNVVKTAADLGDVSDWASGKVVVRLIQDGSVHTLLGVSPAKNPDKTYSSDLSNVTWTLMAAQVISE